MPSGGCGVLDYLKISISPEGEVQPTLRIRYDYDSTDVPQPEDSTFTEVPTPSIFGTAVFGTNILGASSQPLLRQTLTGSGYSNFFKIFSNDTNAPYTLNGLYVNYRPAGRQ